VKGFAGSYDEADSSTTGPRAFSNVILSHNPSDVHSFPYKELPFGRRPADREFGSSRSSVGHLERQQRSSGGVGSPMFGQATVTGTTIDSNRSIGGVA